MPFDAMPVQSDMVLTILSNARMELSDAGHWCKWSLQNMDGALCALGAIGRGAGIASPWAIHAAIMKLHTPMDTAVTVLDSQIPPGGAFVNTECIDPRYRKHHRVAAYNNALTTTHADVLAWFDRAIAARVTQLAEMATAA